MNPNETPEYELDDILTEFSGPTLEDILREFSVPEPEEPEPPLPEAEPATESVIPESTSQMPLSSDATAVFTPIGSEEAEEIFEEDIPPAPITQKEEAEPFSDDWEPEYEEPMGEFKPKGPILFPEKSRLRQLRQKLVAGPERRYQALSEAGIGQLQMGILLNFLLAAISIAITVAASLGMLDIARLRAVVFCQLLLAMLAALVGCYRLLDGISNLLRGRFTLDAALFVTFLACIADGLLCLSTQQLSASSLFCLQVLMAQWSAYQRRNTEMSQMDTLRKASELTALVRIDAVFEDRAGYTTIDGEPEDFLDHYHKPSIPETILSVYTVLSLLTSFGLATATYMLQGLNGAIAVFMAAQLVALPFSAFVSMSRPSAILQRRLHRLGAVLCGWHGVRTVPARSVYPLRHEDLLPDGAIKMNNVKFLGNVDPGRVVSYTTALLTAEESGLVSVFRLMPRSRGSASHTVEDFAQEHGGISGLVDGYRLLVGTSDCMEGHGIAVPAESKESLAIYTAVDNQLCGIFSISCQRSKSTLAGIRPICGDRHFKVVLATCNFLLTPKFLHNQLSLNVRRITFPTRQQRLDITHAVVEEHTPVIALMTKSGLAPKAYALTGARALQRAIRWGAIIHILGGAIGLIAVGVLALNGGMSLLNPTNLLLYSSIWSLPGLLITEHTRHL